MQRLGENIQNPKELFMFRSRLTSVIAVLLFTGGVRASDLMSMVDPVEYLRVRSVEITIDRMIALAAAEIDSPKAQVKQLAALQYLINEVEQIKRHKDYRAHRDVIEMIAKGRRGHEQSGFGLEYAVRLLAKLDGTRKADAKLVPLRKDALAFIPADTKLAVALDVQQLDEFVVPFCKTIKSRSEKQRMDFYDWIETTGNIRLDRIACGLKDCKKPSEIEILVHFTGRGNQAWISEAITKDAPYKFATETFKDRDGTPIVILKRQSFGWLDFFPHAIALIGNSDLIVAWYKSPHDFQARDLFTELSAFRGKRKANGTDGSLKEHLMKVPDPAVGFIIGDLDDGTFDGGPKGQIPARITGYVVPKQSGLHARVEYQVKKETDTKGLLEKIVAFRTARIDEYTKAQTQPPPHSPRWPFDSLAKAMETIQVMSKGSRVEATGFISNTLLRQLGETDFDPSPEPMKNRD
jgi:hypothetical protein